MGSLLAPAWRRQVCGLSSAELAVQTGHRQCTDLHSPACQAQRPSGALSWGGSLQGKADRHDTLFGLILQRLLQPSRSPRAAARAVPTMPPPTTATSTEVVSDRINVACLLCAHSNLWASMLPVKVNATCCNSAEVGLQLLSNKLFTHRTSMRSNFVSTASSDLKRSKPRQHPCITASALSDVSTAAGIQAGVCARLILQERVTIAKSGRTVSMHVQHALTDG